MEEEVVAVTNRLLKAIDTGDWVAYASLCDEDLTCFEPEACGQLVHGLDFHHTYFGGEKAAQKSTLCSPHVLALSNEVSMIAYSRLVQYEQETGSFGTAQFEETRIWKKGGDGWRLVHLHRSRNQDGH